MSDDASPDSGAFVRESGRLSLLTLVSRVLGLVREMTRAAFMGTGVLADAFTVSFLIPNFLRRLTAEGAFSQAFVPVISEYKVQRSHDEVRELVAGVSGTLGLALFVLTLVGVIALYFVGSQGAGKYDAAKERQGFIEGRIKEIESKLSHAQIIDPKALDADGRVVFGATVELEDLESGDTVTYQIVGDDEADIKASKISVSSPIARSLIGKHAGDTVNVQAPGGVRQYEILDVQYI